MILIGHRKPRRRVALAVIGSAALVAGCASDTQSGALIGAGVGALAGQAIGGDTKGTLIGAGVGAAAGGIIGHSSDHQKEQARERPR